MKNLCIIVLLLGTTACQTGVVPISQRNLYEKEGKSAHLGHRRPVEEGTNSSPEVYIKRQNTEIVPQETKNYAGSLFALNSPDNLLFVDPPRGAVGDFLDIAVRVNRKDKPAAATPQEPNPAPADPAAKPADNSKAIQDELISALPKLEPDVADPKVPTSIKMRVVRKLENGDVIVEAHRASQNEWEANAIRAQGRIPREKVSGNGEISTADLEDVIWYQSDNGTVTERESSVWEDEYTMRWAGFNEAKSKMALDLETKRKEMEKVKDRLKERIVNVGKERNKIAQEKEKVSLFRKDAEDKLNDLTQKMNEQEGMIAQQKEVIQKQEKIIESLQQENPASADSKKAASKEKDAPAGKAKDE